MPRSKIAAPRRPGGALLSTCLRDWNDSSVRRFAQKGSQRHPAVDRESADPLKMQEQLMKLNSMQVKQTLNQMEAHVLPDDHPAVMQFADIFGEHTFFLDQSGLKVLEPTEAPEFGMQSGEVVSLADWTDATLTSLRPHEPELTGTIITFPKVSH